MLKLLLKATLLIALLLGMAELGIRTVLRAPLAGIDRLENFYKPASEAAARKKVDLIFVGTSRVAGSINPDVVAATLRPALGDSLHVLNVGKGYSSLVLHYLGLRRLYQKHPEHMRGTTILIEAPSGIALYQEWDDQWVLDAWPTLLGPLATAKDAWAFTWQSANDLREKSIALAAIVLKTVRFWRYVHPKIEGRFNALFQPPVEPVPRADLSTAGGIRADSAGVALVRNRIIETYQNGPEQHPWRNWDQSVLASIVHLVRAHGGDVMFFEMPQSSYEAAEYETPVRQQDRQAFQQWARTHHLIMLELHDFTTTDADFPDLLHMRKSRSHEYSVRVARALLEKL